MRLKRSHFLLLALLFTVAGLLVLLQRKAFVSTLKVVLYDYPDQENSSNAILGVGEYFVLHDDVRSVLLNAHVEHLLLRRIGHGAQHNKEMLKSLQKQLRLKGVESKPKISNPYNTSVIYFSDDADASLIGLPMSCDESRDESVLATLVARAINLRSVPVVLWGCSVIDRLGAAESYSQLDKAATTLKRLQRAAPGALVGWVEPKGLFDNRVESVTEKDGLLLWHYIILKHLIHDNGFLVLPRSDFPDSGLQAELEAMLNLLPYDDISLLTRGPSASPPARLHPRCVHILNSRKYDSACLPLPSVRPPLLFTGLGGCGTHAMSTRLQESGIRAFHERIDGEHGAVCWTYAANDISAGVPYPWGNFNSGSTLPHRRSLLSPRFLRVVHLVREPIAHISSFSSHLNASYNFVLSALNASSIAPSRMLKRWLPLLQSMGSARASCQRGSACNAPFSALAYLLWNDLIKSQADAVYRIEDGEQLSALVKEICALLFQDPSSKDRPACRPTPVVIQPKLRRVSHAGLNASALRALPFWGDLVETSRYFGYELL